MIGSRVVVIMPVYNEARHLPVVLQSLERQTLPRERMFFVAVDGNSTDGSAGILRRWLRERGVNGCIVENPRRTIPVALNLGLKYAREDDIVVRLDAHTVYGPTYIGDAVRALETARPDVGCVGAAHVPLPAQSFGHRVVQALYTNPMGLGGADYRFGNDVREVDNVYLGVWPARVLMAAGGFNEALDANEDAEMSARIREMGHRILRVPLPCRFIINRNALATIRQWHRYGYWRTRMLMRNPRSVRVRHIIAPTTAVLGLATACSPMRVALLPTFAAYGILVYRRRAKNEPLAVTLTTLFYFPAVQLAYVAGMAFGLLSGRAQERTL